MRFKKEFEEYLAELFDYDEDAILLYLDDEELYEDFLKERAKWVALFLSLDFLSWSPATSKMEQIFHIKYSNY